MAFACAALIPTLPTSGLILASSLFAGAIILSFLRDWLVVIGRLDPRSEA